MFLFFGFWLYELGDSVILNYIGRCINMLGGKRNIGYIENLVMKEEKLMEKLLEVIRLF